jgi:chloride channel protein, CIC family
MKGPKAILESLFQYLQPYVRRHWVGFLAWRQRFQLSDQALHLLIAAVIGVAGGGVNVIFVRIIGGLQYFLWEEAQDGLTPFQSNHWGRFCIPAIGGLVAGCILYLGSKWSGRKGGGNLLEAVAMGDGTLPFRASLGQALSSVTSIVSGAAIGREGSITQFTSMLASQWGSFAAWHPYRLRLMVGCGAAAGMAAAYNAPIAGAVFAAHIVLGNFSMHLFAPLVCAAVMASMVSRSFFGMDPLYQTSIGMNITLTQLPLFLLLGVLCGLAGGFFQKTMQWCRTLFQYASIPLPFQMAIGGAAIGGLAVSFPQVLGNGYHGVNLILAHQFDLSTVITLLLLRWVATIFAVGSGAVGGVMTPTLFLGAAVGGTFGLYATHVHWYPEIPVGVFALVGMSSMLAATTHSPLLAMIMIFEISLNYNLMPALMIASAVSTLVAMQVHRTNIYSESLYAKGMDEAWESGQFGEASRQRVGDFMRLPVVPLHENAVFTEIADRFITSPFHYLPVVDAQTRLKGMVALSDLKEYLHMGDQLKGVIALDIMRQLPSCLTPGQRLDEALPILLSTEMQHVPVINNRSEKKLIGSVNRSEALGQLVEAMDLRNQLVGKSSNRK